MEQVNLQTSHSASENIYEEISNIHEEDPSHPTNTSESVHENICNPFYIEIIRDCPVVTDNGENRFSGRKWYSKPLLLYFGSLVICVITFITVYYSTLYGLYHRNPREDIKMKSKIPSFNISQILTKRYQNISMIKKYVRPLFVQQFRFGEISNVLALPGEKLAIINNSYAKNKQITAVIISQKGEVLQNLGNISPCVTNILATETYLYLISCNRTGHQLDHDGNEKRQFQVKYIGNLLNQAPLSLHPNFIPDAYPLLLADYMKAKVLIYNITSGTVETKELITPGEPMSVSYLIKGNHIHFIVCDNTRNSIDFYNSSWDLVQSISNRGWNETRLKNPRSVVFSPDNTLWVAERTGGRISEFDLNGTFRGDLLEASDGIMKPQHLAFVYPYLFIIDAQRMVLLKYKIYK